MVEPHDGARYLQRQRRPCVALGSVVVAYGPFLPEMSCYEAQGCSAGSSASFSEQAGEFLLERSRRQGYNSVIAPSVPALNV